ncbi:MAG: hypothetical protein IPJ12_01880 [Betaproteobacteria bacterium]|nr:hypothetical protein [Betaproteobacteria bacterium]
MAPSISLPKGGGAIRGIGEKFAANPVTGTGSMSVPIATSPGRGGFGPQLALSYDSGAGNGPFGLGWSLSLFTPKARFESFAALNDWLATRCRELAERKHPVETTRTIADCFLQEGPSLRAITSTFDGYVEQMMRVSSTCLVRVERNRYSVPGRLCWQGSLGAFIRRQGTDRCGEQSHCRP